MLEALHEALVHAPARARSACLGLALATPILLAAPAAHAYCRTSTCPTRPNGWHVCTPPGADDCGLTLYRTRPRFTYSIQRDASDQVSFSETQTLVREAFDVWMAADCGEGQKPRLEVIEAEAAICAKHEYSQDRGNANIIFFYDQGWPHESAKIAVTTVTHNIETGEIYDADLEINATHYTFTTTGTGEGIDLPSVLIHETGHFLGLEHSIAPGSVMIATYQGGGGMRKLADDDRAGICAVYPPGPVSETCDATPRHGFSTLCAADQKGPAEEPPPAEDPAAECCCPDGYECSRGVCKETEGGCAAAPGSRQAGWAAAVMVVIAAAAGARRRAARRRSPAR